jgi:hypothetical protein
VAVRSLYTSSSSSCSSVHLWRVAAVQALVGVTLSDLMVSVVDSISMHEQMDWPGG